MQWHFALMVLMTILRLHVLVKSARCAPGQDDWHVTCILARRLVCPLNRVVWEARRAVLEVEAAR